ncbi:hypothetical protein M407DRAFT_31012 [Tulasnella calospora MUT 4182]|uniref:NACHT domain-containing protein n=1 Tax=Tulasnella calospora MUT 4182 TaxID=1051891 RepID=A0A0C3Q6D8_9AGAM|nr:hypothetical protein M407DRAFT_31012 [Tulasnella calospora MUT 4182]
MPWNFTSSRSSSSSKINRDSKEITEVDPLAAIKAILTVAKSGVTGLGVPGLEAAIGDLLSNVKDNDDDLRSLVETLMQFNHTIATPLQAARLGAPRDMHPDLRQRLEELGRDLESLCTDAENLLSRPRYKKLFMNQEGAGVLSRLNQKLHNVIQNFQLKGSIVIELEIHQGFAKTDLGISETKLVVQETRDLLSATISAGANQLGVLMADAQNDTRKELDRVATLTISATERATQHFSQGLAQVSDELSRTETAALLQLLPRAQARYNSHSRNDARGCFEGTRQNTLKAIYDWIGDESSFIPPIFWLCGLAGIGKSTIAHTIAEEADLQNKLGASFFFSRYETDRRNPMLLYPSIAYQLAVFNSDLKRIIIRSLERDPDIGLARMETQFKKLLAEPLTEWKSVNGAVLIVIDALDECSPESSAEEILVQLAGEVRKIPVPLKILITSRPELHIREKFRSSILRNLSHSYALHDIEDSVVQADIELFLRRRLNNIAEAHGIPTPWPTELEIRRLVERSGSLFIFASTAIKFIESGKRRDPQSRLTLLLKEGMSKGTTKYKEVDTLYTQVLQYALLQEVDDEEGSDEMQHLFRVVLETIVLLQDPLPSGPLELLLSLEPGVVRVAIRHLHSIIIVPDDLGDAIRLSHPSFYDYLNNPERCLDSRLSIQPESHARLAKSCLNAMLNLLHKDPLGTGNPWLSNAEIPDLHSRLRRAVSPHLGYCCEHFASHLLRAGCDDKELIELVNVFCNTKLLVWVESLSLLGKVDSGVTSLRAVEDWYKRVSVPNRQTLDLLKDIQRVVLQFGYGIKKSSGHILTTALLFAPPCGLTSQYASSAAVDCVLLGKPSSWEETVLSISTGNRIICVAYSLDGASRKSDLTL